MNPILVIQADNNFVSTIKADIFGSDLVLPIVSRARPITIIGQDFKYDYMYLKNNFYIICLVGT